MTTKLKKSLNRTSQLSTICMKKEQSFITTGSNNESFEIQFRNFCVEFKSWIVPEIAIVPNEPLPGNFTKYELTKPQVCREVEIGKSYVDTGVIEPSKSIVPTVYVVTDNYEIKTDLNIFIFKNFKVDRGMLIALRKTLQQFESIMTLKLEYCQLKNTDLRTLKTILSRNNLLKTLSINGNPNPFQNFYILLKDTQLECISMRLCQVNARGASLIALQLKTAFEQSLSSIDISSNFISDEGVAAIANALRLNRTLLSLNLADNWLTDLGCIKLISSLQLFPLTDDEIVIRRFRKLNYLQKRAKLINYYREKFSQEATETQLQKTSMAQRKPSKEPVIKSAKDSAKSSSKGQLSTTSFRKRNYASASKKQNSDMEAIMQAVENEMGPDNHPFVKDCYEINNEIYCKGNFKLTHLNLSYNNITEYGFRDINEMLRHQRSAGTVQEGLFSISLEGNPGVGNVDILNDIDYLIQNPCSKRLSLISNESKRSYKRKKSI